MEMEFVLSNKICNTYYAWIHCTASMLVYDHHDQHDDDHHHNDGMHECSGGGV